MTQERRFGRTDLRVVSKRETEIAGEEFKKKCTPKALADRLIQMLLNQKGNYFGTQIDDMEHGLQAATRAYRAGAGEETVVCALFHDIGLVNSPKNHGGVAAAILKPYITKKNWWILEHHDIFQGFYYLEHLGLDKNKREVYKDSPYYGATVQFCDEYDAPAFDPDYESMDIETFRPMVERIFSRTPYFSDPSNPKAGLLTGEN